MEQVFTSDFWTKLLENLQSWAINELPGLLIMIVLFIIILKIVKFSINKVRKSWLKHAGKSDTKDVVESEKRILTLTNIIHNLSKVILWVVFIMIILQKINIDIAPILAGAGIIGLAVGFGAQELVRDFISGFFMILENHIRAGDVAIINGTGGLVENMEFRTTTLRDFSGSVHIFQNGKISEISNMTKEWSAMVFDIGVAYKEDPQTVMDIMKEVGDELQADPEFKDRIIEPIEIFGVDNFGDSAVVIKARLKTKPIQQWGVGREYRKRLKLAFDKNNIEIPFPHTTVYWGEEIKPLSLEVDGKSLEKIK